MVMVDPYGNPSKRLSDLPKAKMDAVANKERGHYNCYRCDVAYLSKEKYGA